MRKEQILRSATSSVIQIVVASVVLFFLYKTLLRSLGPGDLGVWSLVLAITSIAQVANLGITGSIVKYVATYQATNDTEKLTILIETATLTVCVVFLALMPLAYLAGRYLLHFALEGVSYVAAVSILPHALVAFWIMMVTSIFQSALYGMHQVPLRNLLLIADSILYLVACSFLAPKFGLSGLATARVFVNAFILFANWIALKRHIPGLPFTPRRWNKGVFREIAGYSLNLQIISLLTILCDPVTKGLMSRYGSISAVGYYEMANRMIQQCRSLLVNANQVLIPEFAHLSALAPEKITAVYIRSYRLLYYLALPLFSAIIAAAPVISVFWIGRYERDFALSSIILGIGWLLNTLCVPAYFASLGTGDLRWNVRSHTAMGVLNVILGLALGSFFGSYGVIAGWMVSLIVGGAMLGLAYHVENGISLKELLPASSRLLTLYCLCGTADSCGALFDSRYGLTERALDLVTFSVLMAIVTQAWFHPMRREIFGWVRSMKKRLIQPQSLPYL